MENIQKLIDFRYTAYTIYAQGQNAKGKTKSLICNCTGAYSVYDNGLEIYVGVQPFHAIEAYNDLGGHQLC